MTRHYLHLARSLTGRGLAIAMLLAVLVPAVADAGTFAAYGPREFFRDPSLGPTESEFFSETFSVIQPALTYTLRVERVRANLVEVDINGTQVVERRDFIDAGSDVVEKTISLWDVNLLELEMQADPDGLVTITIFGPDEDSPTISAVVDPEPNANGWNNTPVTVAFDCSDVTSGIAVCPAAIYHTTETDGRVLSGQAVDLAGNTAETSVTIKVDLGLPSITINALPDPVTTATVLVEGTVDDTFSGLDTVTCNGETAGINTVPNPDQFSCMVDLYLGGNTIVVEATDLAGNVATASTTVNFMPPDVVKQLVDDQAPTVVIDHPADGSEVAVTAVTADATVTGRVIDLLQGFTQSENVEVTIDVTAALGAGTVAVDSATAEVSNGTFSAVGVRLRRGTNTITATAIDAAGNSASDMVTVDVQELSGQRIDEVSGDDQSGAVDTTLAEDLVVRLLDLSGSAVSGRNVKFEVSRGSGTVDGGRSVTVATDSSGEALVGFKLGERSGAGNHQVTAIAAGFAGSVVFTASATPGAAIGVQAASPTDRSGQPSTALPEPLVAYAHDAFGNPVPGTEVDFDIVDYTAGVVAVGQFTDGGTSMTRTTGDDGRAAVFFILGAGTDRNANAITANLNGVTDPLDGTKPLPVTFKISPSGSNAATSVFGLVLDQNYEPLSGVSVKLIDSHIEDTGADCQLAAAAEETVTTNADGVFSFLTTFVDRRVTLSIDGSGLGTPAGQLCLEVVPYTGHATNLGPIFVPVVQTAQDTAGGVTLPLDDLPGSSLTLAAGSATCPDPGTCEVSFTRLANDQLPSLPPRGRAPAVAWSVMPLGVVFDPPAELTVPNTGDFAAGAVVDLWEFDHDLAQFVRFGTGTVSDDAATIISDEGVGISRSGVGYVASSPLEGTWAFSCNDGNQCTCDSPDADFFVETFTCPDPTTTLMLDPDTPAFNAGLCFHEPVLGDCEDGLYCTTADGSQPDFPPSGQFKPDACVGGGCVGKKVGDVDPNAGASARLEIDLTEIQSIEDSLNRTKAILDPLTSGTCEFTKSLVPNFTAKEVERCCESSSSIEAAYLFTPQLFASIGFECTLIGKQIKGLVTIAGKAGMSVNGKLQADFEVSLCPDDDCSYKLSGLLEVEPYAELTIDILNGAAGASAKLAYPVALSATTECSCKDDMFLFLAGGPALSTLSSLGDFPFAVDFGSSGSNCGDLDYQVCAGPARFEGRIKLLGFIKIGFDVEISGTKFCGDL